VELLEIKLIQEALSRCATAAQAAAELGVDASTLSKKRKRYGI
jgi:transcriptional regulator with PAS, ATPase and Fis domain